MATYFVTEPSTLGLCRFIVRIPEARLPNGPRPSDIRGNTGSIEASDIFGMAIARALGTVRPILMEAAG
jgi:rhamnogalacturonan endolyase